MDIVRSSIINEDIIDKVRQQRFGIPDESGLNYKENHISLKGWDEVVYERPNRDNRDDRGPYMIIKNPYNLDDFSPDVRGVIVGKDFYVENLPELIHVNLLNRLEDIIPGFEQPVKWHLKLPKECLTLQRIGDTDKMGIGESNVLFNGESKTFYKNYMSDINFKYKGRIKFVAI